MAAICTVGANENKTDFGTDHIFKVNYSKIKDMSIIGQCVTSPFFKAGGYQWAICFYPNGFRMSGNEGCYASLFLKLLDDHKGLDVSFTLCITRGDTTRGKKFMVRTFNHIFRKFESKWGLQFIERTNLEEQYATSGSFLVSCSINTMNDKVIDDVPAVEDISKLLKTGEMSDVKFEVDGEVFSAHKLILGMRSPVFKAELFGSMSETKMECIQIKDMEPEVFRALLHFVYTYSLPHDADIDMIQHILMAADRYGIDALIMKCQERLIEKISLDTVLGFLNCAERHNFNKLKDACLKMAAQQKNFIELALTEEYNVMIQEFPSLLTDLKERIIRSKGCLSWE